MIKGILFDLDGTIVESESSRLKSSNQVLKEFNIEISQKDWNSKYRRMNSTPMFEDIIKKHKITATAKELYKKAHIVRDEIIEKEGIRLIKGFMKFYKQIKNKQIKMIVCSGGKREHVENLLKKINISMLHLGREDYKNVKPKPDCYTKGLEILKLTPDEVIVFDDSYNGILAAKNAKIKQIIAINSELEKGIEKLNPIMRIKDWTQINVEELLGL